jgi:hypothetical protein
MMMYILVIKVLLWKVHNFNEGIFYIYIFRSVIAPNSYVPAGSRIPAYTLWAGVPVRFVKDLPQD